MSRELTMKSLLFGVADILESNSEGVNGTQEPSIVVDPQHFDADHQYIDTQLVKFFFSWMFFMSEYAFSSFGCHIDS
jgi:hypothetical protein